MFDEETESLLDRFITEFMEAVRDERLILHEGCVVVAAPVGASPEYIEVVVDGINDPNVLWRGVPPALGIGDVVTVWENTVTHRREILGASGSTGSSIPIGIAHEFFKMNAAGTSMGFEPFDWDEANAPPGADVVHDHGSDAEGGQNLHQILELEFQDAALLTINAGTVTRTQVYHVIAAQIGVADDLDNVLGGVEGDELVIRPDAGDTITCRHNRGGAGDFWLAGGADIVLDNEDHLRCICDVNGRWCDQSGGAGGGLGVHDHSTAILGGTDLNPERISSRVVLCGPGLPNVTLGAAVVRVNALGPPALNTEWVIMVMGRTAEAGGVTIPAYCYVLGMEEGSIIGMGANTLTISDNAGLYNVKVTGTPNTLIYSNNASPRLHNVRAVSNNLAGGSVFNFAGTSSPVLYDCIAEVVQDNLRGFYLPGTGSPQLYRCRTVWSGGANPTGFNVAGACTPLLEHCLADDSTNFLYALTIGNVAATVTTRYCTLRAKAAGSDVNVLAAATWQDVGSNYDADNLNVLGTFVALPQSPVNLDGRADALILDADGDTTISAPTDDQIDVEIAGADDFRFTADKFSVLAGSHVSLAETVTPVNVANTGLLYCNDDGAGNTELYFEDESGNVSKLTPPTWVLIAETTLVASVASVTFAAIPQTYRHLKLIMLTRTDAALTESSLIYMQFNADAGNNYDYIYKGAVGGGAFACGAARAVSHIAVGDAETALSRANCFAPAEPLIYNYASATMEKNVAAPLMFAAMGNRSTDADLRCYDARGAWRSTAAITTILLYIPAGGVSFVAGSKFQLYGIL